MKDRGCDYDGKNSGRWWGVVLASGPITLDNQALIFTSRARARAAARGTEVVRKIRIIVHKEKRRAR